SVDGAGWFARVPQVTLVLAHRLRLVRARDEAGERDEVEIRQDLTVRGLLVSLPAQDAHLDPVVAPDPGLGDLEAAVDLELVDAPVRPDDLDREIRALG